MSDASSFARECDIRPEADVRATASLAPPRPLTDRQREVLDFIRAVRIEQGRPPTNREIGRAIGIKSTNGVNDHLEALRRKGYIDRDPKVSRGIIILACPGVPELVEEDGLSPLARENLALRRLLKRAQDALAKVDEVAIDVVGVLGDVRKALDILEAR